MKYGPEKSATDKETEKTLKKRKICIPDSPGACFRSRGRPIFAGKNHRHGREKSLRGRRYGPEVCRHIERRGVQGGVRGPEEQGCKESHEVAEETILINFVELDRFTKGLEESEGTVEKWCYALKHMWKLHDLPDGLRQTVFERLFEACEIARFSPDKRLRYEKEMITERDYRNILETAREDGFAEGEAKGLAEGKAEGSAAKAAEIARAMLASGMDIPLISSLTGLPEEEVKRL